MNRDSGTISTEPTRGFGYEHNLRLRRGMAVEVRENTPTALHPRTSMTALYMPYEEFETPLSVVYDRQRNRYRGRWHGAALFFWGKTKKPCRDYRPTLPIYPRLRVEGCPIDHDIRSGKGRRIWPYC